MNRVMSYFSNSRDKFEVKYLVVDRSTFRLYSKIKNMRKWDDKSKKSRGEMVRTTQSKLINTLLHDINQQFSQDIGNHLILQKTADAFFVETQLFFSIVGLLHFFLNFIPFVIQIFYVSSPRAIVICNSLCILKSVDAFVLEMIGLWHSGSFKKHFVEQASIHNYMDQATIIFQILYSSIRIYNPEHVILPETYKDGLVPAESVDNMMWWSLACVGLTFLHIQQIYKYMRV